MKSIGLKTFSTEYSILIGKDILEELNSYIENYDKILILSNENIGELYFQKVEKKLLNKEKIYFFMIKDGEKYKNIDTVMSIYDYMIEKNFSRKSLIIALGGGVICDITGFVAATYMRGIDYIQVPTSLLAQVDASIGGKTAIDHPKGKNLIGTFKQPKLVLIDIEFLKTLPKEQFSSGMAEIIKHSLIIYNRDKEYFEILKKNRDSILQLEEEILIEIIFKSCMIKKEIVERDEFETGERALLNLGHTYGHTLEKIFNFQGITHGEAISKGTIFELNLSGVEENLILKIKDLFRSFNLNSNPIYIPEDIFIESLKTDKKNSFGKINFILFDKDLKLEKKGVEISQILEENKKYLNRYIRAVIDIGTNSCRLFLAQILRDNSKIVIEKEISKDVEIVKLGEDVNKNKYLKKEAIERTLDCLKRYKEKADSYGAKEIVAFATSATRDSQNRDEFLNRVKEIGIDIKCITGVREAQLNFLGNSIVFKDKILVVDIGGGSTEFTLGENNKILYNKSFNIGAVRATEKFFKEENYSEDAISLCKKWIEDELTEIKSLKNTAFKLVGVAGTATTQISVRDKMKEYDMDKVHLSFLNLNEIENNLKLFLEKELKDRKNIIGLEPKRADVIIAGTIILITIMQILNKSQLIVSESDNLNGAMITEEI